MRRSSIIAVFWLLETTALAGCWDSTHGSRRYRATAPSTECRQAATCGACTPLPGCGWCSVGGGGYCVEDPAACAGFSQFQWTWDPGGCPASQTTSDGGSPGDAQGHDAAASETAGDAGGTAGETGAAGAAGAAGGGGVGGAGGGTGAGGAGG